MNSSDNIIKSIFAAAILTLAICTAQAGKPGSAAAAADSSAVGSAAVAADSLVGSPAPVIDFPLSEASSVAVVVRDLRTGSDIVSQNPRKAMIPASTMKCVTAAAAIVAGIDNDRFRTDVYLQGPVTDSILHGNIVVNGIGDPTIESGQFPETPGFVSEIVLRVKERGIKVIQGDILVDDSGLPNSGPNERWELSDVKYDYGAGLFALNFRDNKHADKAMKDPAEEFGDALEEALARQDIIVLWDGEKFDNEADMEKILTHESPNCGKILRNMIVRSDNLFAEGILRKLAPGGTLKTALSRERQLLANKGLAFGIEDLYDGSGLSRNNRVTADFMASLLTMMADEKGRKVSYVSLFPRCGMEGTVKQLLKGSDLEGKVVLKSGSMNGVHCYSGYKLDDNDKPTHAIVILVNDFFCKRADVRSAIDRFLRETFIENQDD